MLRLTVVLRAGLVLVWQPSSSKAEDALLPAPRPYVPSKLEVEEYAAQAGVTDDESERRLLFQSRTVTANADLERQLGLGFGGAWFDPETGDLHIATTTDEAEDEARSYFIRRGITEDVEFDRVKYSSQELADGSLRLADDLTDVLRTSGITSGEDVDHNGLKISVSKSASEETRARVESVRRDFDLPIRVVRVPDEQTSPVPNSCAVYFCTAPMRGGVAIAGSLGPGACTAGYAAYQPSDHSRYVFTAGHCTAAGGSWSGSFPGDDPFFSRVIGPAVSSIVSAYGDEGAIKIQGGDWNSTLWPYIVVWNPDGSLNTDAYAIYDRARSTKGQFACHVGWRSHLNCGTVYDVNQSLILGGHLVGLQTEAVACGAEGDSGGPWVSYNYALGIHVGASSSPVDPVTHEPVCVSGTHSWYSEVLDAEALLLNTRIVTFATGPQ